MRNNADCQIDVDALARYHEEIAEQAAVDGPPRVIGGCPTPREFPDAYTAAGTIGVADPIEAYSYGAVADSGSWTAETGVLWESEREALVQRVLAERQSRMGDHRADGLGVPIAEQPADDPENQPL